jgi:ribosomal-protein-alanine N-acetyltransferase
VPAEDVDQPIPIIHTPRLTLESMSIPMMQALAAGDREAAEREAGATIPADMPEDLANFLQYRLGQLAADPSLRRWLARAMVLTEPDGRRRVIGTIGFHGAPDEHGRLEVGYRIEPQFRRRGYTREAVQALFDWAATEHGIRRFIASVRPDNEPSLALVRGFGFVQTGTQMDEVDGLELVLEATLPPRSGPDNR